MFSHLALDHINNRRSWGQLADYTSKGAEGVPGEGPYCVIYVRVDNGIVSGASYQTNGCPTAIASASILVTLITGRSLASARMVKAKDLKLLLGQVPEGKEESVTRAISALSIALEQIKT